MEHLTVHFFACLWRLCPPCGRRRVSPLCASYSEIHEETGSNPIRSKQFSCKVLLGVQQLARDFISVLCTLYFVRSSKKLAR
jgi:hypothetical protein